MLDDAVGYTGSFNLVDPRFFKQDAGVGEWVDAMVRLEGPAVPPLNALFRWKWEMETGRDPDVQVIPSGPGIIGSGIYQLRLMSIYSARQKIERGNAGGSTSRRKGDGSRNENARKLFSATATPLASIFGSGFLVIVPSCQRRWSL